MKTTVNSRVKLLRTSLRLTQNEFAAELGISPSLVSKMEAGEKPSPGTLDAIINTYSVPEAWLIEGKGDFKFEKKKEQGWKDEAWLLAKEQIHKKDEQIEHQDNILKMLAVSFDRVTKMMHDSGMSFLHPVSKTGT